MIDQQLARLRTHRSNIQRYRNLLQTSLTELERQFVEKRLTEEQTNLESLAASLPLAEWKAKKVTTPNNAAPTNSFSFRPQPESRHMLVKAE